MTTMTQSVNGHGAPVALFGEYAHGAEAARIFGVTRADSVWRMIERHAAEYPGRIEVVTVGRMKTVRRDELEAFTSWFAAGPGGRDARIRVGQGEPVEVEVAPEPERETVAVGLHRAKATDARRRKLARQIARLTGI